MMARSGSHQQSRRNLLAQGIKWAAAGTAGLLALPLIHFARFRVKPKPRFVKVSAPLPLAGFHVERDFILFFADDSVPLAVSRRCTHLGCRISYLEDKKIIECPCHQSRFTVEGKRISGPARRDLETFPVTVRKDSRGKITDYVVTLT